MPEKTAVAVPIAKATVKPGTLQRKCACGGTTGPSGMCPGCEAKMKGLLQRKEAGAGTPAVPAIVDSVLSGSGRPLDAPTRRTMESGFGTDLSSVRIHTDSRAAESARAVDAHAYTVGQNIAFGHGKYDPQSPHGQRLIAHEVAHTIQQGGLQRSASTALDVSPAYSAAEAEADRAADAVVSGRAAPSVGSTGLTIARAPAVAEPPGATPTAAIGTVVPAAEPVAKVPAVENAAAASAAVPEKAPDLWAGLDKSKLDAAGVKDILQQAGGASGPVFVVDKLQIPETKGKGGLEQYKQAAQAKALFSVADTSVARGAAAFKGESLSSESMASLWLKKSGWSAERATALWNGVTGNKDSGAFSPKVGERPCYYETIFELFLGGTKDPGNVQIIDENAIASRGTMIQNTVSRAANLVRQAHKKDPPKYVSLMFAAVEEVGMAQSPGMSCQKAEAAALAVKDVPPAGKDAKDATTANPANTRLTFGERGVDLFLEPGKTTRFDPEGAVSHLAPGFVLSAYTRGPKADSVEGIVDLKALFALVGAEKNEIVTEILKITNGPKVRFAAENPPAEEAPAAEKAAETKEAAKDAPAKPSLPQKRLRYGGLGGNSLKFEYAAVKGKGELKLDYDDKAKALVGKGSFKSELPFLKDIDLGINLVGGALSVTASTKNRPLKFIPGASIKDADLKIALLPKLGGAGSFTAVFGSYATAKVKVAIDDKGVQADGSLQTTIPKIDAAAGEVHYKEGAWSGKFDLAVSSTKIPGFQSANINVDFKGGRVSPSGTINLRVLGTDVKLGVKLVEREWYFSADVPKLKLPGLEGPISVFASYTKGRFMATGKNAAFTFGNWAGNLAELTYDDGKISGNGTVEVGKPGDRVSGVIGARLFPNGKWTADGTVSVKIREGLVATVGLHIDENQKVLVKGALEFPTIEIPKTKYGSQYHRDLARISFPIVGISVGPKSIGFSFDITGGIGAGWSIGPARVEGMRLAAQFNPFEANTDYELEGTGKVVVPMDVAFNGTLEGALSLDAFVASGSFGLQATLGVGAKAESKLDSRIRYKAGNLSVDSMASIVAKPYLTLALDAVLRAKVVGFDPYMQKYPLKAWRYDTGLDLGIAAPFKYESAKGFQPPSLSDVKVMYPDINVRQLMNKLTKEVGIS